MGRLVYNVTVTGIGSSPSPSLSLHMSRSSTDKGYSPRDTPRQFSREAR